MNIEKNKEMLKETHESEMPDVQYKEQVELTESTKGGVAKIVETSQEVTEAMIKQREQLMETAEKLEQQATEIRSQAELVQQAEDVKMQLKYQQAQKEAEMKKEKALEEAERISEDLSKGLSAAKEKVKGLAHSVASTASAGISKVGHMGTLIKETIVGVPDLATDLEVSAENLELNAAELRRQAELLQEHAETASEIKVIEREEVKMDIPMEDFSQSDVSQKMEQSSPSVSSSSAEYTVKSSVQPPTQFGGKPLEQSEHELKSVPRSEFHINKDEDILLMSDAPQKKSKSVEETVKRTEDESLIKQKQKSQSTDDAATYDESKRNVWKPT